MSAAEPGYAVERVTFRDPIPLERGFERVEAIIEARGRPLTAFCACELRSPAPFTDAGFRGFNELYVATLARWGIYDAATKSTPSRAATSVPRWTRRPSRRSTPSPSRWQPMHARRPSWSPAAAKRREGGASYRERTVRYGETSADGNARKSRLRPGRDGAPPEAARLRWADTTATQVYTVHELHPFLADEIVRRGAARGGLTWHFCRPPVQGLEYEMDCRGVAGEHFAN